MSAKLTGEVNLTRRYSNIPNTSGTIITYRYHRFMPVRIRLSRPSSKKSRPVGVPRAEPSPLSHFAPRGVAKVALSCTSSNLLLLYDPSELACLLFHRRVACLDSHCAHRTSTVSSCAFCEQKRAPGYSPLPFSPLTEAPPCWL